MTKYHFPLGQSAPAVRTAMIIGTGRSGKTTFGNILATCKNVEYQDEPWSLHIASVMTAVGLIESEFGKEMFNAAMHELVNDTVLLRNANFRPADLSTIVNKKTPEEIQARLQGLQIREDAKNFIEKNNPLFLLAFSADPGINLSVLADFLPKSAVLSIVRKGIDVAHQVVGKGWFSDAQIAAPSQAQVAREVTQEGAKAFVYAWVPKGEEKQFLSYSEFERGLYYWCTLVEQSLASIPHATILKYEDLLQKPDATLQAAMDVLGLETTKLTHSAMQNLVSREKVEYVTPEIDEKLRARAQKLYEQLRYEQF